jgi:hypothetical protein
MLHYILPVVSDGDLEKLQACLVKSRHIYLSKKRLKIAALESDR